MKVVSLANFKGGCGRTTLTCILALYFAEKHKKTVGVRDLDSSSTSQAFVERIDHPRLLNFSGDLACDLLFIDTPAAIRERELAEVVSLSDLVVLPMSSSPVDAKSTKATASAISTNGDVRILFNNVDSRTASFKSRGLIAETIGLPCFRSFLENRVSYTYALNDGIATLDQAAKAEVESVSQEILNGCYGPSAIG